MAKSDFATKQKKEVKKSVKSLPSISEKTIKKDLKSAAKILNKDTLKAESTGNVENIFSEEQANEQAILYTVWCPDQHKQIGSATTSKRNAVALRNAHNRTTGHNSTIIDSE